MKPAIGAITIGQSPRDDVLANMRHWMGAGIEVLQSGALDGLSRTEVAALGKPVSGPVLVTRMRDGSSVLVGEEVVFPRIQRCITRLMDRVELILLLCTGSFPDFGSRVTVLYPGRILYQWTVALRPRCVAVLTPAEEQRRQQEARWKGAAPAIHVEVASPYGELGELEAAAVRIRRAEADLVVMDCIGYTDPMRSILRATTNRPTLVASTVLARVARELLER